MSDPVVPQTPAPAAAVATGKPKNASRTRSKAMKQFDSTAPKISVDRFFSDFTEIKRNNVDVVLNPTLLDRIAEPYIVRAHDFESNRTTVASSRQTDTVALTYGMVGVALVRKLLLSAPASVQHNLSSLQFIKNMELYAPPSLCTALDNLGKFSQDDFTIRIEFLEQDIYRFILRICKSMNLHRDFVNKYNLPGGVKWDSVDPEKYLVASESSARWLQNLGKDLLSEASYSSFTAKVSIGDREVEVQVTFPHLKIVPSRQKQIELIVAWLNIMNAALPEIRMLVSAALFLVWSPLWFDRTTTTFANLDESFVDTFIADLTPSVFLDLHKFKLGTFVRSPLNISGPLDFLRDVHSFVINYGPQIFDKFLKLTKQPDNQFGTIAQMLELDPEAWVLTRSRGKAEYRYYNQSADMSATSLMRIKDKGAVTSALLFGFVSRVRYSNNFSARLNGPITTTRQLFFSSDFTQIAY